MVRYLDLLQVKTYEIRKEIAELNSRLNAIEADVIRNYFQIGKKVAHECSAGCIVGEVKEISGEWVTIRIICVDDDYSDIGVGGYTTYKACELNLV